MAHNISDVNITRVLRMIWLNQGLSRVDISRRLDLNKSTVSKIVAYLHDLGIVEETEIGDAGPSGGRRPILLRVRPDHGCVMGIEIQTEAFTVVGINLHGYMFFSHTEPLDLRRTTLLDAFVSIVERFRSSLEVTGMPLTGIGVGLPGFVDPVSGTLIASMPFEQYEPVAFLDEARQRIGEDLPIFVDNDANCGCWGELAFRHSNRPLNMLFVLGEHRKHTIDMDNYRIMALGLGLVLNGDVHRGSDFSAGEFRSILYRMGSVNQFSVSDAEARRFLQDPELDSRLIDELSRHIAFLVNALNLRKIVIGGPIEILADELTAGIREHVQRNWAYPNMVNCQIAVSRLGEQAVAYGAAAMFLEHLIRVPAVGGDQLPSIASGVGLLAARGRTSTRT